MEKEERKEQTHESKELMISVLRELGCNPEEIESDDDMERIGVMYQGSKLVIDCLEQYVQIWELGWASARLDNPIAPHLKEAVNRSNFCLGATVVTTEQSDEGIMYLHTKMTTIFIPALPEIKDFTSSILNHVVYKKNNFHQTFQELMNEKQAEKRNRRPIGFAVQREEEVA